MSGKTGGGTPYMQRVVTAIKLGNGHILLHTYIIKLHPQPPMLCDCPFSRARRRFNIVNPTNTSYEFAWLCEDSVSEAQPQPSFKCLSPSGSVEAGKKKEVSHAIWCMLQGTVLGLEGGGRGGAGGCMFLAIWLSQHVPM